MNAAIAVFSHGKLPLLCIARQPGLLHTGLRVLLASKARHYTVCVLEPWAADLPFGVEIPPNLLFGRLGGHFGPGRARLADHLHTIGHVHLCLQLVQVVTSPCSLLPQQAHAGSANVGQKKDDMDVGELRGAEAADVGRGSAWGSSKENAQPLVVRPLLAARVTWVWKMSVLWVFK